MIRVTNIERFATHDGPGIRTTVFLKGCPLHCPWCANPETQAFQPQLLHAKEKCVGCRECEKHCKEKAITFQDGTFRYDTSKCVYCFTCEDICLHDAIEFHGKDMEIDEVMQEVMKDKAYYDNSKGGITVSGGEPFVQFDALLQLLGKAKAQGLHTAIETTGNYSLEKLQAVMPYMDLFLFDFKHIDNGVLKNVIGANGIQIKENLKYLLKVNAEQVHIRIPVIPNFNFNEKDLCAMLDFIHSNGALYVDLLPYHSLGKSKYERMGKEYTLPIKMLEKEDLNFYKRYAEKLGLKVRIGG